MAFLGAVWLATFGCPKIKPCSRGSETFTRSQLDSCILSRSHQPSQFQKNRKKARPKSSSFFPSSKAPSFIFLTVWKEAISTTQVWKRPVGQASAAIFMSRPWGLESRSLGSPTGFFLNKNRILWGKIPRVRKNIPLKNCGSATGFLTFIPIYTK